VILRRARPFDVPTIIWRSLSKRARLARHRQVTPFTGISSLRVKSLDERLLPLQVDGDFIGDADEAVFTVESRGIAVVA
jgi:hypothetical protein